MSCGLPPGATAMALWEVPRSIPTEGVGGGLRVKEEEEREEVER